MKKKSIYYIPLPHNFDSSDFEVAHDYAEKRLGLAGAMLVDGKQELEEVMRSIDGINVVVKPESKHFLVVDRGDKLATIYPPLEEEKVTVGDLTGNPNALALAALFNAIQSSRKIAA